MDPYDQFGNNTSYGYKNVRNANRVYINPNFQKNTSPVLQNGLMYLNPQFHPNPNIQASNVNKPKIYVNPNFVRTNTPISNCYSNSGTNNAISSISTVTSYYGVPSALISGARTSTPMLESSSHYSSTSRPAPNIYYENSSNSAVTSTDTLHLPNVTPNILPQNTKETVEVAVAKSRYSLVRRNNNAIKTIETPNTDKIVTKMKISKYKTVSIENVKKMQIEKAKPMLESLLQTYIAEKTKGIIKTDFVKSRFKLIKNNTGATGLKIEFKSPIKRRHSLNSSKALRSNQRLKVRVDMKKFKKNNIPCPLFKKYGTCLRNDRGKCEFLHDKKHVSICRRFLKGVCYDENCLLSHEVTAEKMPTCSFYLKGMCNKEDCPYLHVKLNEKTKICLDFLKGYCEKGKKCLNRHVNICPDKAMNGACLRKPCPYPHRINNKSIIVNKTSKKLNQSIKSKLNKKIDKKAKIAERSVKQVSNVDENKDCRYYKEVVEDASTVEVEVIKPIRCKLGALPSFIQL